MATNVGGTGAGVVAARRVADAADHRSMSPLESGLRGVVLERGMSGFRLQVSWEQVMYDQTWVGDTVDDVLRLRGGVPDRRNWRVTWPVRVR